MKVHPVVTQLNGIISVVVQAQFIGDITDVAYKNKIQSFGDPEINIAGTFIDPSDTNVPPFSFQMPTTELYVGITTELSSYTARFMTALPLSAPGNPVLNQGPLDVVTSDPGRALQVWYNVIISRIQGAITALNAKTVTPTLVDQTV